MPLPQSYKRMETHHTRTNIYCFRNKARRSASLTEMPALLMLGWREVQLRALRYRGCQRWAQRKANHVSHCGFGESVHGRHDRHFLESSVIHTARMSCQIKLHELRAKNGSGAASTVKLLACESILFSMRKRPWKRREWAGVDMHGRVRQLGWERGASRWERGHQNTRNRNMEAPTTSSAPMTWLSRQSLGPGSQRSWEQPCRIWPAPIGRYLPRV